jgi:hypothetical protein
MRPSTSRSLSASRSGVRDTLICSHNARSRNRLATCALAGVHPRPAPEGRNGRLLGMFHHFISGNSGCRQTGRPQPPRVARWPTQKQIRRPRIFTYTLRSRIGTQPRSPRLASSGHCGASPKSQSRKARKAGVSGRLSG